MMRADLQHVPPSPENFKKHFQLDLFLEYAASNWWRNLGNHLDSDHSELRVSVRKFTMCQKNIVKWLQIHQHLQVEARDPSFLFKPTSSKLWSFLKDIWVLHLGRSESGVVDHWNRWEIENCFTLQQYPGGTPRPAIGFVISPSLARSSNTSTPEQYNPPSLTRQFVNVPRLTHS